MPKSERRAKSRRGFVADYMPRWVRQLLAQHPDVAAYLQDCVGHADHATGEVSRAAKIQALDMGVDRSTVFRRRAKAVDLGLLRRLTNPRPPRPGEHGEATVMVLPWAPSAWRRKSDAKRATNMRAALDAKMLRSRRSSGVASVRPIVGSSNLRTPPAGAQAPRRAFDGTFLVGSGAVPNRSSGPRPHEFEDSGNGLDCGRCQAPRENTIRHPRIAVPA